MKLDDIQQDFWVSNQEFTQLIQKQFTISFVQFDGTIQFETRIPDYIYNECIKQSNISSVIVLTE
jgi:hypothetical protein